MSHPDERFMRAQNFIANPKFQPTKFREGYAAASVYDLLDQIAQTLLRRDPAALAGAPQAILNAKFEVTKFREGYDMGDVDDFLDELITRVESLTTTESSASLAPAQPVSRVSPAQPFDGAFFAAVKFSEGRFLLGYNKKEVDDYLAHVKEVVWRNDASEIYELSFEPQPKKFSHTSLFTKGYSLSDINEFTKAVSAKAATY